MTNLLSTFGQPLLLAATTVSLYALGLTPPETSDSDLSLIQKVGQVAITVFKATVSLAHYWINPTIATITFFATVVWAKEAQDLATRINDAWKAQPWSFACLTIAATALSLPVALVTGTVFWACSMGLSIASKASQAKSVNFAGEKT